GCNTQLPLPMESSRSGESGSGCEPITEPPVTRSRIEPILWMRDVVKIAGVHRCTIHRCIQLGRFPAKDAPRGNPVGWLRTTIQRWLVGTQRIETDTRRTGQ